MNIAVLEDNPAINEYLTTALEMAGHHVDIYTQGEALLEALFTNGGVRSPLPYDLITVDILLPGALSGLEVIARIRDAMPSQPLPVIVISGASQPHLEQVITGYPHIAILEKPFKRQALLQLLEELKVSQEN